MSYLHKPKLPQKSHHLEAIIRETENKSRELGRATMEVDSVNNHKRSILSEVASLEKKIPVLEAKLKAIDEKLAQKKTEYKELVKKYDAEVKEKEGIFAVLQGKAQELASVESELKIANESLSMVQHLVIETKGELVVLDVKQKEVLLDIENMKVDIAKRESQCAQMEKDVDDKISKNGIMVTRIEVEQRTLEQYVKRLQKHYDEQGININILNEFGIKRDNT